jgi:ornithine cyclodeaminase
MISGQQSLFHSVEGSVLGEVVIDIDKAQIEALFDFTIASEAVRAAFVASSRDEVQAPAVAQLTFPVEDGDCCVKTGHIHGSEGFVVKISTGFYRNPEKGLSSSNGMNLVFSAQTGVPMAILRDEGWLTDMRTGIGGALATVALAPAGFTEVLIVGTGLQARYQARCLQALAGDTTLNFAIWGRDEAKAHQAASDLADEGLQAGAVSDLAAACQSAQAIITCTPAKSPLIAGDWITPGTHITAIGADCPGKQELAVELLTSANLLVCDEPLQSLHHGEFQNLDPDREVIALGEVLSGQHPGRRSEDQITIADLTGLAVQDAAVSLAVLRAAKHSN